MGWSASVMAEKRGWNFYDALSGLVAFVRERRSGAHKGVKANDTRWG